MKNMSVLLISALLFGFVMPVSAATGVPATDEDIWALKEALRGGIIQIGKTRLHEIREVYGEAPNINEDLTRISYDYGDVRIEFLKRKVWKYWEYDSFKKKVYTSDVEDLRFAIEADEIVGDNITYESITREYGEPTESYETDEDGKLSIYYYGDIKLVFENKFVLRSWRGSISQSETSSTGVLNSTPNAPPSEEL